MCEPIMFKEPLHLVCKDNQYDVTGVVFKNVLCNEIELLCAAVKHPVTLFSFYDKDKDGKMMRFDSAISTATLHYCCEAFRICAGKNFCEQSDIEHALLFKGIDKPIDITEMEETVNSNIEKYLNRHKINTKAHRPVFVPYKGKGYVKYYCPILGYQELIFPIIICGKVLGVIFCGQIQHGDEETIKNIRLEYLNNHSTIFDNYFETHKLEKKDGLLKILHEGVDLYKTIRQYPISEESVKLLQDGWINDRRPDKLNEEEFDKLIEIVVSSIDNLTNSLNEYMLDIRKNYISQVIKNAIFDFCDSVMSEELVADNTCANYWNYVEDYLDRVVEKLYLKDIQVYGTINPSTELHDIRSLNMVAYSVSDKGKGDIKKDVYYFKLEESDKNIKFPFLSSSSFKIGNLNIKATSEIINRIVNKEGLEIKDDYSKQILFYPVRENLNHSSALVIEYYNPINNESFFNYDCILETIITEMYPFSNLIFYIGAFLLNGLLQSTTEMILRFFKHELSHVLLGYNFLNEIYIQDIGYFFGLDDKKRDDVIGDFISTEETMRAISNNIELLTKPTPDIKLNIEEFKIFKELLFKWENLYRYEISAKSLSFKNPNINFDDPSRPLVKTDKRLLEQIIYNIVHNAIKYSNYGTKIVIDCKLKNNTSNSQVLTIEDYGCAIELGEKPYMLYYRKHDIKNTIEGSGIGLFVVKRISDILHIKVKHTCEWISDYNVALIDSYIYTPFLRIEKSKRILHDIQNEKKRLGDTIKKISSEKTNSQSIKEEEIARLITQATYRVKFEVEI